MHETQYMYVQIDMLALKCLSLRFYKLLRPGEGEKLLYFNKKNISIFSHKMGINIKEKKKVYGT